VTGAAIAIELLNAMHSADTNEKPSVLCIRGLHKVWFPGGFPDVENVTQIAGQLEILQLIQGLRQILRLTQSVNVKNSDTFHIKSIFPDVGVLSPEFGADDGSLMVAISLRRYIGTRANSRAAIRPRLAISRLAVRTCSQIFVTRIFAADDRCPAQFWRPLLVDRLSTLMRSHRSYLEGCATRWDEGSEYHWIVEERSSNGLAGCIACRVKQHAADFGYFFAEPHWGKGFATEAGELLVSWLKAQPEILRIWATADTENVKSRNVLERLGLQCEGILPMATYRPNIGGPPRDTVVYAW
jgi:RimJ/RimL family protein N-acetyltransferase